MEEADFEAAAPEKTRSIDIVDFVNLESIDPIYFHRTYFLEPTETGAKAYHLLKRAMQEKKKIAIAKIIIRSRENLAAVRLHGPGLALETMYYANEIRSIDQLVNAVSEPEINERELEMAMMIIDNLTTDFQPEKYRNEYRDMLVALIERENRRPRGRPCRLQPAAGKVIDLMAALEASVQATKGQTTLKQEPSPAREPAELTARLKGRRRQTTEETG